MSVYQDNKETIDVTAFLNSVAYLEYTPQSPVSIETLLSDARANVSKLAPDKQGDELVHIEKLEKMVKANTSYNDIQLEHSSRFSGDRDEGTNGALYTYTNEAGKQQTILSFRGTSDSEWIDNGQGAASVSTVQQERALAYFKELADNGYITEDMDMTITGHSKGGNKAQYIMLNLFDGEHGLNGKYANLIDNCYSMDGQGFSPEAIEYFQRNPQFAQILERMYGINGNNDYVSQCFQKIIPAAHTVYLDTSVDGFDFVGYHDIYFLYHTDENGNLLLNGEGERGEFSLFVEKMMEHIMSLTPDQREKYALTIMQIMQYKQGVPALNGGDLTLLEFADGGLEVLPILLALLLTTKEGQALIAENSAWLAQWLANKLKDHVGEEFAQVLQLALTLVVYIGANVLLMNLLKLSAKVQMIIQSIKALIEAATILFEAIKVAFEKVGLFLTGAYNDLVNYFQKLYRDLMTGDLNAYTVSNTRAGSFSAAGIMRIEYGSSAPEKFAARARDRYEDAAGRLMQIRARITNVHEHSSHRHLAHAGQNLMDKGRFYEGQADKMQRLHKAMGDFLDHAKEKDASVASRIRTDFREFKRITKIGKSALGNVFSMIWDGVKGLAKIFLNGFSAVGNIIKKAGQGLMRVGNAIRGGIKKAVEYVKRTTGDFIRTVSNGFQNVKNAAGQVISAAGQTLHQAGNVIRNSAQKAGSFLEKGGRWLIENGTKAIRQSFPFPFNPSGAIRQFYTSKLAM